MSAKLIELNEANFGTAMPPFVSSGASSPVSVLDDDEVRELETTDRLPLDFANDESKFDWTKFMNDRGSLPAATDLIGDQQLHLERRVSEVLFRTDTPVMVGGGPQKLPAVVQCVVGGTAFVHFVGDKTMEDTKLEELILATEPYPTSAFSKDNLFHLRNYSTEQLMAPVGSMVKVGNFFELIDKHNPRVVYTVRITANSNGYVQVIDGHDQKQTVFITSDRCKRIGWSMLPANHGHFQLCPFLGVTISKVVPFFVFTRTQIKEHNVERNHWVEVIDPITRYRIVPGLIVEIFNKYFFRVQLPFRHRNSERPISLICHRGSPDLLPGNFCSRTGLRLTVPEDYDKTSFSAFKLRGRQVTESYFDLPKSVERFDSPRHVEIYDEEHQVMIPATILRNHRHLLILRMENRREFTAPKIYSYFDERVCKVGTAEKCGIPFCRMPETIDSTCWVLGSKMELVTDPRLHNPAAGRRFMVRAFANASQFIPRLFVNFNCYKGPFVNDEAIRFLDSAFPSSPLAPAQQFMIQQMLEYVIKRDAVKHCIQHANSCSIAPKYSVTVSNPKNEKRSRVVNVEVCEKAEQFAGWLRQFLLQFDICPNFISPVKRLDDEPCPLGCHLIERTEPWMRPSVHLHNPIPLNKQEELRARRQNGSVNGPPPTKRTRSDLAPFPPIVGSNREDVMRHAVRRGNGPLILMPRQLSDSSASQSPPPQLVQQQPTTSSGRWQNFDGGEDPGKWTCEKLVEFVRQQPTTSSGRWRNFDAGEDPGKWTCEKLVEFVRQQPALNEVATFLEEEEFDGQSFFLLTAADYKKLHLKRGPQLLLQQLIQDLKTISRDCAFSPRIPRSNCF